MRKLARRLALMRGLLHGERAFGGPAYVDVDLTGRCNLLCDGCPYHSPRRSRMGAAGPAKTDLRSDLFLRLIDQLRALGPPSLTLQGAGEPLLHPQFLDLLGAAKRAGLRLSVLTNATLLDERLADSIVAARLDVLRVSIWATNAAEFSAHHSQADGVLWGRALDGVRHVTRARARRGAGSPHVLLHLPITGENHSSLTRFVDLAQELGADGVSFSPLRPLTGGHQPLALRPEDNAVVERTLDGLRADAGSAGLSHNIDETLLRLRLGEAVHRKLPCYVAWYHARVRADGVVTPCGGCRAALGDLNRSTFGEIWNGPAARAFRRAARRGRIECDGAFCCFARDNWRVHRWARWLTPPEP